MSHHLSMVAYEMNDEPLSYGHGAPLRLRNELQHGFRHVKWLKGIEFVKDYCELGSGTAVTTKTTNSSGVTKPSNRPKAQSGSDEPEGFPAVHTCDSVSTNGIVKTLGR